jgi:hypothetical protein
MPADAAGDYVTEVIVELPLRRQKTIQEPQVEMLKTVKLQALLVRRQPAKDSDINVVIMASDVDKTVMD